MFSPVAIYDFITATEQSDRNLRILLISGTCLQVLSFSIENG